MLFHPSNEKGQGLTEFALILILIAVVCVAVLVFIGPVIGNLYNKVIDLFP